MKKPVNLVESHGFLSNFLLAHQPVTMGRIIVMVMVVMPKCTLLLCCIIFYLFRLDRYKQVI